MDTRDFITNVFRKTFNYNVCSKSYSCHEDDFDCIIMTLTKHFASQEEKEKYDQEITNEILPYFPDAAKEEGFIGFYTGKKYYLKED